MPSGLARTPCACALPIAQNSQILADTGDPHSYCAGEPSCRVGWLGEEDVLRTARARSLAPVAFLLSVNMICLGSVLASLVQKSRAPCIRTPQGCNCWICLQTQSVDVLTWRDVWSVSCHCKIFKMDLKPTIHLYKKIHLRPGWVAQPHLNCLNCSTLPQLPPTVGTLSRSTGRLQETATWGEVLSAEFEEAELQGTNEVLSRMVDLVRRCLLP